MNVHLVASCSRSDRRDREGDRGRSARGGGPMVESTLAAVWRLATFPESGRVVPEVVAEQTREVISGSHRIIYRIEPSHVSVLTVRHQRQSTTRDNLTGPT